MFADFAETIDLCSRDFGLIRRPRACMVNGRKRSMPPQDLGVIRGSMQNPRDHELQDLPEGQRREGIRSFYTTCKLELGEVGDANESDRICDALTGYVYEVYAERNWAPEANYYRYLLRKVGQ